MRVFGSFPAPLVPTVHSYMEPRAAMTLLGDLGASFLNCRSRGWRGKDSVVTVLPRGQVTSQGWRAFLTWAA